MEQLRFVKAREQSAEGHFSEMRADPKCCALPGARVDASQERARCGRATVTGGALCQLPADEQAKRQQQRHAQSQLHGQVAQCPGHPGVLGSRKGNAPEHGGVQHRSQQGGHQRGAPPSCMPQPVKHTNVQPLRQQKGGA